MSIRTPGTVRCYSSTPPTLSIKVESLLLDDGRPPQHLRVDGSDVLTEQSDEHKLNRADKKHPDHQRRRSHLKARPEQQLVDQVDERHEKAECADSEPAKDCQSQRNLRVIGDPKHSHVPQSVEIVLGE